MLGHEKQHGSAVTVTSYLWTGASLPSLHSFEKRESWMMNVGWSIGRKLNGNWPKVHSARALSETQKEKIAVALVQVAYCDGRAGVRLVWGEAGGKYSQGKFAEEKEGMAHLTVAVLHCVGAPNSSGHWGHVEWPAVNFCLSAAA
jgi:hypothetical protein